ncbi:hyccin isoform X2 [Toxorhynchites rutilus septentrionalis]|uniref:hyccin isoform X2 n=1 Tax=Toxorhynchites rutilus septentrionalis TaxID=329112 RepID=UPI00247B2291|nr:hyccin isoform X2 [Toxorhynchites rutilus septentrionalis]
MAEAIIADWISDYNSLQESERRTFATQHENDYEISKALYTILNERAKYKDLIHPVCNQLCSFYRSSEIELRRFTLQFVPILIYLYLNSVALGDKKSCRSIETLLICIYNIEVSADDGSPKVVSFRMPVLAQASIYHEEKSLHPSDLRRWEENSNKEISWGPLPSIESINAQNRLKVMTALLFTYNQQLNQIHKPALYHLCKTTSLLVNQGFSKVGHVNRPSYGNDPTSPQPASSISSPSQLQNSSTLSSASKPLPRIAVSTQFLVELAHANYFAMFNEFASAAIEAVNDLHNRACYEMLPEVILVTNAIRNSLHANPSGQPSDGPMGISVALTPATTTVTVSKSMITNASFRTKKLPDDLEVEFVNSLQSTQQEMMVKLAIIEADGAGVGANNGPGETGNGTNGNNGDESGGSPKAEPKKKESRKWKNWGWKNNNASTTPKQTSIEEEGESPKKSASSKHSSPAESPKHKLLGAKATDEENGNNISPASLRRKKFLSSKNQSPVNRSEARASAGARLYEELESLNDSDDELQALIINGRPATIHLIQPSTIPDDIPIQGPKEENGQLSSINEEGEGVGDGPKATSGTGAGPGGGGGSGGGKMKDSKTHKVLGGFKKLIDKDKEKEKEKDDGAKQTGVLVGAAAKKASAVKEKLAGKQSLQMQTGSAELFEVEKTSPLLMAKRKSSSIDIISMPAGMELITSKQSVALTNGGVLLGSGGGGGGDEKSMHSLDALDRNGGSNPLEVGESFDSGNDMTINNNNNNLEKSVQEIKTHGSIQVSQV